MTLGKENLTLVNEILELCRKTNLRLCIAESCTGGLFGATVTQVPGASDIFHGGLIAYDNRVKRQILGVLDSDLNTHGAVSEVVARQMAKGIRLRLGTEIGLSITGIAGPTGGSAEKPVGTVWVGFDIAEGRPPNDRTNALPEIEAQQFAKSFKFDGDRDEVRAAAVVGALEFLKSSIIEMTSR